MTVRLSVVCFDSLSEALLWLRAASRLSVRKIGLLEVASGRRGNIARRQLPERCSDFAFVVGSFATH